MILPWEGAVTSTIQHGIRFVLNVKSLCPKRAFGKRTRLRHYARLAPDG